MSFTAFAWALLFIFLAVRALSQPIYGVCLYLLTFFAAPQFWWWGEGLLNEATSRWNLIAAGILAYSVYLSRPWQSTSRASSGLVWRYSFLALTLYTINAAVVHVCLANNSGMSWISLDLVAKQLVLTYLLFLAIKNKRDLMACLVAIFVGCTFIGYQVVINKAGGYVHGRLENIFIPGTSSANGVSAILIAGLCVGGYLFLSTKRLIHKALYTICCVLILETILRCNSRGAFLGLAFACVWMIISTAGRSRKRILLGLLIGVVAFLLQARNDFIWRRFDTTFATADDRDNSAEERILYWKAGMNMITDYPLGSGGEAAFKSPRGNRYISHVRQDEYRAIHNGYLDIAAGWGLQGFVLLTTSLGIAFMGVWRVTRYECKQSVEVALLGATIQAIFVSQLVTAIFLSRLDHEIFNWLIALCAIFYREYSDSDDELIADDILLEESADSFPNTYKETATS